MNAAFKTHWKWALALGSALTLAVALVVGGGARSEAELIAAARAQMQRKDLAAASIHLKTLLQSNPTSGEARFLLGKVLADSGDLAGAETEFRRALDASYPVDEVGPVLASVLNEQQKPGALLLEFAQLDLKSASAAAELKAQVAAAYIANNDFHGAEQAINQSLQSRADHVPALILSARLMAGRGDLAAAQKQAQKLLTQAPDLGSTWLLKGDLHRDEVPAQLAAAAEAYRQALRLQPGQVQAHVALLSLLISQRQFDAANTQWIEMKKALPLHAQTLSFEGMLALQRGDAARAREVAQLLLAAAPDNPRVLMMAGQAEHLLGAMQQAEATLAKVVQLTPEAAAPRRLLATVHLETGQSDKALQTLKPLLSPKVGDAQAQALAGRAQLIAGDVKSAQASFAQALKLDPNDKQVRTSLALSRLGKGNEALNELADIAKTDDGSTADLAIISARMARRELDEALAAVNTLAAKQPKLPLADVLRGRIALMRQDAGLATQAFEAALAKDPTHYPAVASLSALDLAQGKPDSAKARFEALLKRDPNHAQAKLSLAALAARGGQADEAQKLLTQAVSDNPGQAMAHAALIDHHLARHDFSAAVATGQASVAAVPNNIELLDRLGRALLANGDPHQARLTFNSMGKLQPNSPLPQVRLAELHLSQHRLDEAWESARRALAAAPQSLPVQQLVIGIALRHKRGAEALVIARKIQAQRPNEAVGHLLEGEIELAQAHPDAAAAAFRKAIAKADSVTATSRLHLALTQSKKQAEAEALAKRWMEAHPNDTAFMMHLAEVAASQDRQDEAEARYREVLKREPDNVLALNNLASLLIKAGKPGARALAERATKLAPRQAELLDTLALAHAQEKDLVKAIDLQAQAVGLAPSSGALRLQLAKFYLERGDVDMARAELDRLARMGGAFDKQAEVKVMLKNLSS